MKTLTLFIAICLILALIAGTGCTGTYNTTLKSELKDCEGEGPLRALTIDTLLYTFEKFTFTDSLLSGSGTLKKNDKTAPFSGSVPFRRIAFIERTETSYWKPVWVIPMVAGVAALAGVVFSLPPEFEIWRPSDGSSCPSIYAFDGKEYKLEAEAFGTSISKAFEARTFNVLPSLTPANGNLHVRVANERPETHLINSVRLFAADARGSRSAVLDVNNVLWPLDSPAAPSSARDHSGNDVLSVIRSVDAKYWQSDLAHTTPFSGFLDQLELQFDIPSNTSDATLVVKAINTELITEVYRSVGTLLGDESLKFYMALEHDTQLQSRIRGWIHESSLAIEAWDGKAWKEIGRMQPEATAVAFCRAIRIPGLQHHSGSVRLRLSSLTDSWRIDAVLLDCSIVQPLELRPLELTTVSASDGKDWRGAIAETDAEYALLFPPQYLDVSFDARLSRGMQNPLYVFAAQGYLYEWFPDSPGVKAGESNVDRVALLKMLIREKNLFLPPIYAQWEKSRR